MDLEEEYSRQRGQPRCFGGGRVRRQRGLLKSALYCLLATTLASLAPWPLLGSSCSYCHLSSFLRPGLCTYSSLHLCDFKIVFLILRNQFRFYLFRGNTSPCSSQSRHMALFSSWSLSSSVSTLLTSAFTCLLSSPHQMSVPPGQDQHHSTGWAQSRCPEIFFFGAIYAPRTDIQALSPILMCCMTLDKLLNFLSLTFPT